LDGVIHLVELKMGEAECRQLQTSLKEFYKLVKSPQIEKSVFVLKDDIERRFIRPRIKESQIKFNFADKSFMLHEILTEPEGATEKIFCRNGDSSQEFKTYLEAEQFVISQYKEYLNGNSH